LKKTLPYQPVMAPYPFQPIPGTIDVPPAVQLRLRALASRGYKLAALRQVVDLTGAPITIARAYIEHLIQPEQPAEEADQPSPHNIQRES
jgi:hypothetical protein